MESPNSNPNDEGSNAMSAFDGFGTQIDALFTLVSNGFIPLSAQTDDSDFKIYMSDSGCSVPRLRFWQQCC